MWEAFSEHRFPDQGGEVGEPHHEGREVRREESRVCVGPVSTPAGDGGERRCGQRRPHRPERGAAETAATTQNAAFAGVGPVSTPAGDRRSAPLWTAAATQTEKSAAVDSGVTEGGAAPA
jgi:hypothetical protein